MKQVSQKKSNDLERKIGYINFISVLFLSIILRAPIVIVGTLSNIISSDLHLTSGFMGLLTTLPLITFSISSFLVVFILKRFSMVKMIVVSIVLILIGIYIRSFTTTLGVYFGTVIMGLGIGFENVLILRFIKEYTPNRIGIMTSIMSGVMAIMSGIGAWLSIEVTSTYTWNWRIAISIWIYPTLVALLVWIIQLFFHDDRLLDGNETTAHKIHISPNVRSLLIYIGLQSFLFYCMIAWLPSILQSKGTDTAGVGQLSLLFQFVNVPAGFIFPLIAQKIKRPEKLSGLAGLLLILGLFQLVMNKNSDSLFLSVSIISMGLGGSFSLGMTLINMHAADPQESSTLAGKALSFGYLFASAGPFLIGYMYDLSAMWKTSITVLFAAVLFMMLFGWQAGVHHHN